ncbi:MULTISPECIES: methionyl-tRNA formyltransferase [unclassified Oceanispirochaeta]|uniref:methionyl-tRNA formyltransferase n=1 Tax=unclassified Oceanispirochaeta TaxID=2635722 RepID=UPI000E091523|nr:MULTISPECIES: methionyl-tRNA formyltransferase [unclassified Oceanispirochaeta]MBF9018680.1 methionyl-tRNA formyltransferase [Oceanispirochaeta sp. M2]NPD75118.1 methionyl-tRNA formyltransferase [Oceanispirochaeta sp. M1]RDG29042.1 methionyl-tRNA formyltransferase [Oceanispirochaeta sp. M1]
MQIDNIIIFGSGFLAIKSLQVIIQKYDVVSVYTHPDNSGESLSDFCSEIGIICYRQKAWDDPKSYNLFRGYKNSILISINYKYIIPYNVFSIFNFAFNIHGSLLPVYRGRSPHVWTIMNGENETGITSHIIVKEVDAGNIIEQVKIKISKDDTGDTLLKKMSIIYPDVILASLNKIKLDIKPIIQDEAKATYYGLRTSMMSYLNPYLPTQEILNFIRALSGSYPNAYFFQRFGKKYFIEEVKVLKKTGAAIGLLEEKKDGIYLNCKDNQLKLIKFRIGE